MDENKQDFLKKIGFSREVMAVKNGKCPFCLKPVNEKDFEDELSKKEYRISGLCQACMDKVFSEEEEPPVV